MRSAVKKLSGILPIALCAESALATGLSAPSLLVTSEMPMQQFVEFLHSPEKIEPRKIRDFDSLGIRDVGVAFDEVAGQEFSFAGLQELASTELSLPRIVYRSHHQTSVDTPFDSALEPVNASKISVNLMASMSAGVGKKAVQLDGASQQRPSVDVQVAKIVVGQSSAQMSGQSLSVKYENNKIIAEPEAFIVPGVHATVKVDLDLNAIHLFVRDTGVVSWDKTTKTLEAKSVGSTEVFLVKGDKMAIVPVEVGDIGEDVFDISVPSHLMAMNGGFGEASRSNATFNYAAIAKPEKLPTSSLQESRELTRQSVSQRQKRFVELMEPTKSLQMLNLDIQVVDDRTDVANAKIFPVANVNLKVLGTSFERPTDVTGHQSIRDVPAESRLTVAFDDASGTYQSGVAEFVTGTQSQLVRMRALRSVIFDSYLTIAGIAPLAGRASACFNLIDADDGKALMGARAELDVEGEGPYFFNEYGFLDTTRRAAGPNGRVCFFNVKPGLAHVSLSSEKYGSQMQPLGFYAGMHREKDLYLNRGMPYTARLSAMASASEQLSEDRYASNSYYPVDFADMIPFGSEDPMFAVDVGSTETTRPYWSDEGRALVVSQSSEFEQTLYSINKVGQTLPLMPRGFIEDMALFAQVTHDPLLGSVVVEYGETLGLGEGALEFRLTNEFGQSVGEGWYYSDSPISKAIFFNVPPGVYQLSVYNADEVMIQTDVAYVYSETTTFNRYGSSIRYRP